MHSGVILLIIPQLSKKGNRQSSPDSEYKKEKRCFKSTSLKALNEGQQIVTGKRKGLGHVLVYTSAVIDVDAL